MSDNYGMGRLHCGVLEDLSQTHSTTLKNLRNTMLSEKANCGKQRPLVAFMLSWNGKRLELWDYVTMTRRVVILDGDREERSPGHRCLSRPQSATCFSRWLGSCFLLHLVYLYTFQIVFCKFLIIRIIFKNLQL